MNNDEEQKDKGWTGAKKATDWRYFLIVLGDAKKATDWRYFLIALGGAGRSRTKR